MYAWMDGFMYLFYNIIYSNITLVICLFQCSEIIVSQKKKLFEIEPIG